MFFTSISKKTSNAKLTVGTQFYLQLLWTYLFGFYCVSNGTLFAFMWNELVAQRGANEVVSSLPYFIFNTKQGQTGAFGGLIIVLVKIETTVLYGFSRFN